MAIYFGGTTPYTLVTDSLVAHYDAADGSSYPGSGSTWYDISGNNYDLTLSATNLWVDSGSMSYMNFEGGIAKYLPGGTLTNIPGTDTNNCTIVMFSTIKAADSDWKTLIRDTGAGNNHGVIISSTDGVSLGMYDNNTGNGFQDTGFDVSTLANHTTQFHYMAWKLSETTSPYYEFFYDNNLDSAAASLTATAAKYVGGTAAVGAYHNNNSTANSFGQEWGKINIFLFYSKHLSTAELTQNYNYLNNRYGGPSGESTTFSNIYIGNSSVSKIYRGQTEVYTKPSTYVEDDLILYWDVNDTNSYPGTGTTIYDISDSGTAYDGTFVNTITYTTDNGYNVLGTNGSNSYIYNSSINLSSTNYTVMVGSRYTSIAGRLLNAHSNNWLLGHWDGKVNMHYAAGWITPSTGTGDTSWRIYTATGDISGDSYSFYSNNGSPTTNSGGSAGPNGFDFGRYGPGNSEWGAGYLSFLLVYNRILTTDEMTQNYNAFKDRLGL